MKGGITIMTYNDHRYKWITTNYWTVKLSNSVANILQECQMKHNFQHVSTSETTNQSHRHDVMLVEDQKLNTAVLCSET